MTVELKQPLLSKILPGSKGTIREGIFSELNFLDQFCVNTILQNKKQFLAVTCFNADGVMEVKMVEESVKRTD